MRILVKIQMPQAHTPGITPQALVYNKLRTYEIFLPLSDELKSLMRGRAKAYFYASHNEDTLRILAEAPEQDW